MSEYILNHSVMQSTTHLRSCVNCYQRKLKCDRQFPCVRCTSRNVQCVFPENKITRNRPKKSTSPTLHEKVARLEKEVIGIKDAQSNGVTVYAVDVDSLKPGESLYVMDDAGEKKLLSRIGRVKIEDEDDAPIPTKASGQLDYESPDEDKPSVPFMLPMFSSMTGGPSSKPMYLPTVNDFENFFTLFCERVDPIVRILHKPTVNRMIKRMKEAEARKHKSPPKPPTFSAVQLFMPEKWSQASQQSGVGDFVDDLSSHIEHALLMAIAYSATCSLLAEDLRIVEWFGETLDGLRKKITFATEVSMSRLKMYSTRDFTALQAFTLYITTKILDDNSPDVWHTLWCPVALAVSVAHSMNVHKDGYSIGLSPFDTELRRRLWWHLVILQVRTSENYSCELFSPDGRAVRLPANINDNDMDGADVEPYGDYDGPTEMTASLLRYEAIVTVAEATQDSNAETGAEGSKEAFANKIQRFEDRLNAKYLSYARVHTEDERSRLIIALGTIAILKMCWVWGFRLMCEQGQPPQLSSSISNLSDELFITATRMLEQQILLNSEPSLKNLWWILRNIKPWDGAAILLAQIKVRLQSTYKGQRYDQLPQLIKDGWEVATRALESTQYWAVDKKLVDGLEKMHKQIAKMMGLGVEGGEGVAGGQPLVGDGFGSLPNFDVVDTSFDGMEMDAFITESNAGSNFSDPWPMFIPMNFSSLGGGF